MSRFRLTFVLGVALVAFLAFAYGPDIVLPFMGDDYIFLDSTSHSSVLHIWSRDHHVFGWYRPWSRELHFWLLQHTVGQNPVLFRTAGMLLWLVSMLLYALFLRRFSSRESASVAMLGAASMALWGTPLIWISGSQDLWMLVASLSFLLLLASGRHVLALCAYVLALLSKETAAVLPLIGMGYLWLIQCQPLRSAARRVLPLFVVTMLWLVLHPTLIHRLVAPDRSAPEVQNRPLALVAAKNLLSTVNLHMMPLPTGGDMIDLLRVLAATAALLVAVSIATAQSARETQPRQQVSLRSTLIFSGVWAALGWFPLFLPSIGWHAYYGCLGALGAWVGLGALLGERRMLAIAVITCMGLLRGADALTVTWDWGNEWYQHRAGRFLSRIQEDLRRLHPSLPPHSRVYFGHIPNNIGLVAGSSPAVRVWYSDTTLQAGFYSAYQPRAFNEQRGSDYFFRLDSLRGLVEVVPGFEAIARAIATNPEWESDHLKLAMLFVRSGDVRRAATEFEKLSVLPQESNASLYAAVCRELTGQPIAAESLYSSAAARLHVPRDSVRVLSIDLKRSIPLPGPPN